MRILFVLPLLITFLYAEDELKWSHIQNPKPTEEGFLESRSQAGIDQWWNNAIKTLDQYDGPIKIEAEVRTNKDNIRFGAFKGAELILNWEQDVNQIYYARPDGITDGPGHSRGGARNPAIEPGRWAKVVWTITNSGMTLDIDSKRVITERKKYADLGKGPVRVGGNFGSTVQVRKLEVTQLKVELPLLRNVPTGTTENMLSKVSLDRDIVAGAWTWDRGDLVSDNIQGSRVEMPYVVPAEYDLNLEFTRVDGNASVTFMMAQGAKAFVFEFGGWDSIAGFGFVDGKNVNENEAKFRIKDGMKNGKRFAVTIQVRKTLVQAKMEGKTVSKLKTDYSNMTISPVWELSDFARFGVGVWGCKTVFHKFELTPR